MQGGDASFVYPIPMCISIPIEWGEARLNAGIPLT